MGAWFWLNIPLALLFVCCWAGIPLWLTLTRWNAELEAKHAEVAAAAAAGAVPVPAVAQSASASAQETGSPAYAGLAGRLGR